MAAPTVTETEIENIKAMDWEFMAGKVLDVVNLMGEVAVDLVNSSEEASPAAAEPTEQPVCPGAPQRAGKSRVLKKSTLRKLRRLAKAVKTAMDDPE